MSTETFTVKKPSAFDKVHRDECMFGFDTPEADTGLFVNMTTFQAFGTDYVGLDRERTGQDTYLHVKWTKVPKKGPDGKPLTATSAADDGGGGGGGAAAAPDGGADAAAADGGAAAGAGGGGVTKFAIGVEGGFQTEDSLWEFEKSYKLAKFPGPVFTELPSNDLPAEVKAAVDAVINHEDAAVSSDPVAWEEKFEVSAHALGLVQLDSGKRISPRPNDWKCELCDKTDNLWLNLSDGFIGCGRKQADGSGGNGHALQHYTDTGGLYPLCVKLGTITAKGGDVYSYDPAENDMVENPNLAKHLEHWGINMMKMEKTEKTMAELNIDHNLQFDFKAILESESGKPLVPRKGPGFVGLRNLGNSCYVNSVLQVLFGMPEFAARYFEPSEQIFRGAPAAIADDLVTQMAKVAVGILSDKYVHPPPTSDDDKVPDDEVAPRRLRELVGRGHYEFSTGGQQDACEYLTHLLQKLSRAERTATDPGHAVGDLSNLFTFDMEQKLKCGQSGKVRYTSAKANVLTLQVPLEAATNRAEVEAAEADASAKKQKADDGQPTMPRLHIPFEALLERYKADSVVSGWSSPATGKPGDAIRSSRMATMPRYLVFQVARYVQAEDWTVKKLDCIIPMPEELDIESMRGRGLQPGEEELPADAAPPAPAAPEPSAAIVSAIAAMGFSENAAKRAALATNNADAETATAWLFSHMEDPDINDPLPAAGGGGGGGAASGGVSEAVVAEAVGTLGAMGFGEKSVRHALGETGGNLERAAEWLFSHADDLPAIEAGTGAAGGASGDASESKVEDGPGKYELVSFISHMGKNLGSGHYVCHIKKGGNWTLFNDSKVAFFENPPFGHGYVYVYRRKD